MKECCVATMGKPAVVSDFSVTQTEAISDRDQRYGAMLQASSAGGRQRESQYEHCEQVVSEVQRIGEHYLDVIRSMLTAHSEHVEQMLQHALPAAGSPSPASLRKPPFAPQSLQGGVLSEWVRKQQLKHSASDSESAGVAPAKSTRRAETATPDEPQVSDDDHHTERPSQVKSKPQNASGVEGPQHTVSATSAASAGSHHSLPGLPRQPFQRESGATKDFEESEVKRLQDEAQHAVNAISKHSSNESEQADTAADEQKEAPQDCNAMIEKYVHSRWFEVLICTNIVVNVMTIAAKADARMRDPGNSSAVPAELKVIDITCTVIFTFELGLRLWVTGRKAFFDSDKQGFKWNVMDFVLVIFAIIEGVIDVLASSVAFVDLSALRLFGLGRLVRVIPSTRFLRSFSDLRVMILSILYGLGSMFWSGLVLSFVVLLIAICIMELLLTTAGAGTGFEWSSDLEDKWGHLWISLYTVYRSITGGIDWSDAADPLWKVSGVVGLAFCCFIAFSQLLLLNVMTGIFVKNASDASQRDEDTMMLYELDQRRRWVHQVVRIFEEADKGNAGKLSKDEFCDALGNLRIQLLFNKLGIDIRAHSPQSLFMLFDYDGSGSIEISEFASALHHFHGNARSVDVAKVKFSIKNLHKQVVALSKFVVYGETPDAELLNEDPERIALQEEGVASAAAGAAAPTPSDGANVKPRRG
mmetsp:Transcript_38168/g.89525  ORF Transcript_38168/g.89525 Transcript_38168/m.89525 type:complete len:699 (+) Transcript_38168:97-2193(+)